MKQLIIPGLEDKLPLIFPQQKCNYRGCKNSTQFLAIYFVMGHYNEDDDQAALIGYDCPFEDSPTIYGCNESHLEQQIRQNYEGKGSIVEEERIPDIIVNAVGSIQPELYDKILGRLGETLDPQFLTTELYSGHRESLEELWERESWRWV